MFEHENTSNDSSPSGDPRGNEANGMNSSNGPANSGNYSGGGGGIRDIDTSQAASRQDADRYSNNVATQEQNNARDQATAQAQATVQAQNVPAVNLPSMVGFSPPNPTNIFSNAYQPITPYNLGVPSIMSSFNPSAYTPPQLPGTPYAPTNIREYTEQRMSTPYQGTMLNAAMYPGDAFGMGYPSLVGKTNTREGAAGFLGNLGYESGGFNPAAMNASGATGLAQWMGERKATMLGALGIDPKLSKEEIQEKLAGTTQQQLAFALNELTTKYPDVAKVVATTKDPYEASQKVLDVYENPSDFDKFMSSGSRAALANQIAVGVPTTGASPALSSLNSPANYGVGSPASAYIDPSARGFIVPGTDEVKDEAFQTNNAGKPIIGGAPGGDPNAANINPTGEIDWSKGNLPFIDNTKAKEDLYNQPNPNFPGQNIANSVTGDTPETYAQKFTDGDVSKVQSRITNMNGFPQVEFFSKGLDQIAGEIFSGIAGAPAAIASGIGNIFTPAPAETAEAAKAAQTNPAGFFDFLSGILNPKPTTSDNGYRSSQTQLTYPPASRETRGGETVPQASYPAPAAASQTVAALETPQNPVYTTGIDLLRKKYIPRGSVATRSNAYT